MKQGQPSNSSEGINVRTIVELFSLLLSFSFALSALFFYFVFRTWGINYFFIASVQDVIFGGLFTFAIISSVTFLISVIIQLLSIPFSSGHGNKEKNLKRNRRIIYSVLISVAVTLYVMLLVTWYNVVPSWFTFRIDFDEWTYRAIIVGLQGLSFIALFYLLFTKIKFLKDRLDIGQLLGDPIILTLLFFMASILLFLLGREAAANGFVGGISILTPQFPGVCEDRVSALWIGERYVVGRCEQRVLLLPSGELVLVTAGD